MVSIFCTDSCVDKTDLYKCFTIFRLCTSNTELFQPFRKNSSFWNSCRFFSRMTRLVASNKQRNLYGMWTLYAECAERGYNVAGLLVTRGEGCLACLYPTPTRPRVTTTFSIYIEAETYLHISSRPREKSFPLSARVSH